MPHKLMYDVAQSVERTGVPRTRLFADMASGELESVLVGRRRLIPADALVGYVERLRSKARTGAQ